MSLRLPFRGGMEAPYHRIPNGSVYASICPFVQICLGNVTVAVYLISVTTVECASLESVGLSCTPARLRRSRSVPGLIPNCRVSVALDCYSPLGQYAQFWYSHRQLSPQPIHLKVLAPSQQELNG